MTAPEGSFQPARRGPVTRAALLFGHYSRFLASGLFVIFAAYTVVVMWAPHSTPLWVSVPGRIAQYAFGISAIIEWLVHDRKLCERCIAQLPLDPQAALDKHRDALRFYHLVSFNWRRLGAVAVVGTLSIVSPVLSWAPTYAKVLMTVLSVLGIAAVAGLLHSAFMHRWLRTWCPWCNPGGGGGGDQDLAPTPDPSGTATR